MRPDGLADNTENSMPKQTSKSRTSSKLKRRKPVQCSAMVVPLVRIINKLRSLVIEHHSYSILRDEHCVCPVCSSIEWDQVLNEAATLAQRHNTKSSHAGAETHD